MTRRPGPRGKTARNRRIRRAMEQGLGCVRIGRRFKLCPQRAHYIMCRERRRASAE